MLCPEPDANESRTGSESSPRAPRQMNTADFGSGVRPVLELPLYPRVRWQVPQTQPSDEAEAAGVAEGR